MFVFGHVGLTLGAFKLFEIINSREKTLSDDELDSAQQPGDPGEISRIDYRLVIPGSLLPTFWINPSGFLQKERYFRAGEAMRTLFYSIYFC